MPAARTYGAKFCSDECCRLDRLDRKRVNEAYRAARKRSAWRRRLRGIPSGFPAKVLSREIHERDGWVCYLCATPVVPWPGAWCPNLATIDHVVPLARGGHPTDPANLRTACSSCNSRKADKVA